MVPHYRILQRFDWIHSELSYRQGCYKEKIMLLMLRHRLMRIEGTLRASLDCLVRRCMEMCLRH